MSYFRSPDDLPADESPLIDAGVPTHQAASTWVTVATATSASIATAALERLDAAGLVARSVAAGEDESQFEIQVPPDDEEQAAEVLDDAVELHEYRSVAFGTTQSDGPRGGAPLLLILGVMVAIAVVVLVLL